jgi:hypothetical protein
MFRTLKSDLKYNTQINYFDDDLVITQMPYPYEMGYIYFLCGFEYIVYMGMFAISINVYQPINIPAIIVSVFNIVLILIKIFYLIIKTRKFDIIVKNNKFIIEQHNRDINYIGNLL